MLKEEYEVDSNQLKKILDEIYLKLKDLIDANENELQEELSKMFGIKKESLKNYHYGLLPKDDPVRFINRCLSSKEQVVDIAKKIYLGMGFNIDKLEQEGKIVLDLFPRKNKNTHSFSYLVHPACETRVLANLTSNVESIDELNHELGHCMYTLGNSPKLSYFDKFEHDVMTEAIALMMGDLHKKESVLLDIVPKDVLDKYKKTFVSKELRFIVNQIFYIDFEKRCMKIRIKI